MASFGGDKPANNDAPAPLTFGSTAASGGFDFKSFGKTDGAPSLFGGGAPVKFGESAAAASARAQERDGARGRA